MLTEKEKQILELGKKDLKLNEVAVMLAVQELIMENEGIKQSLDFIESK